MSRAIHKFPISDSGRTIFAPEQAEFLAADCQLDQLVVWAIVDTDAPKMDRPVAVIGTGRDFAPHALGGLQYLSTVRDGALVWHVFVPASRPSVEPK